jgi:hypothetical protein
VNSTVYLGDETLTCRCFAPQYNILLEAFDEAQGGKHIAVATAAVLSIARKRGDRSLSKMTDAAIGGVKRTCEEK